MIRAVAIIGAGTMGRRIAFACVTRGVSVRLYDISSRVAEQAAKAVRATIVQRLADGLLEGVTVEESMRLLSVVTTLAACVSGVQLAIETVPESIELKREVFAEIDRVAAPDVLIGTNTSSIPGSRLADATRRPEKVFNFNWGHVGHRKVELMPHPGTASATMDRAVEFIVALGLIPIRDRVEILGYASNRIWRAVKREVLYVLETGALDAEGIDRAWMLDWHVPVGPCGLMDRIGLDVIRDIEMIYYEATHDPSDRPPPLLEQMVAAGKLGVKSGEGFYRYPHPAYEQEGFLQGGSH